MDYFTRAKDGVVSFVEGYNFKSLGQWSHVKIFAGFVTLVALMKLGYIESMVTIDAGDVRDHPVPLTNGDIGDSMMFPAPSAAT